MTNIIALVDGSTYSESVCDHAAWLAERLEASIEITHVLGRRHTESTPQNLSGNITLGARSSLLAELTALDEQRNKLSQKRGRAILDDAKARIDAKGSATITTTLRIEDIVDTVTNSKADIVLLGKRGEAADFAKLHLGSNLERIARASHQPLFVASRAFRPIKSFLIAYDGGTSSLKAVDYVARSPLFRGLDCTLLTVGALSPEVQKQQDNALAILAAGGIKAQADIVPGQADTVISNIVDSESIDLLVMGAYGHSRIRNLIIGSTTSTMLRLCKIPVMMFR